MMVPFDSVTPKTYEMTYYIHIPRLVNLVIYSVPANFGFYFFPANTGRFRSKNLTELNSPYFSTPVGSAKLFQF